MNNLLLNIEWQAETEPLQVLTMGNVQDVIYSRANQVQPLPENLLYGLGALSTSGPEGAGEGILIRGHAGMTAPTIDAGLRPVYRKSTKLITSPFFLGWRGQPLATVNFLEQSGVTLHDLYRTIFMLPAFASQSIILVELIALLPLHHIHDRALQRPAHIGNVDITAPDYANDYFRFHIIQQDMRKRGYEGTFLLPLAIVGIGFRHLVTPTSIMQQLGQAVFYNPPDTNRPVDANKAHITANIRTHSHAIGWLECHDLRTHLLGINGRSEQEHLVSVIDQRIFPALLVQPPDYVVHLDDWSLLVGGLAHIFALSSEHQLSINS